MNWKNVKKGLKSSMNTSGKKQWSLFFIASQF